MSFKELKLGTKLFACFIATCLISAIVGAVGIHSMSLLDEEADHLYQRELLAISYIKDADIAIAVAGRSRRNALLVDSTDKRAAALREADQQFSEAQALLSKAAPLFAKPAGQKVLAELNAHMATLRTAGAELNNRVQAVTPETRDAVVAYLLGPYAATVTSASASLDELTRLKEADALAASDRATEVFKNARVVMIALILASLAAGLSLGFWITRSVMRQLGAEPKDAMELALSVSRGDLSVQIPLRDGDTSSLMASLKTMQQNLLKVVSEVRQGAESVATASAQIAQGNHDLSGRTEEQASALEETAASMEELSSTVTGNADNARQASQLAQQASTVAISGGEVVGRVVETMKGINDSSKKIGDIIGVIDSIAFQTNILALNAAVEAARAGEQGRGFAVVASEVRNLAHRSAEAAKEIKGLISVSVERVEQGTSLVDQAGETMKEVVSSIRRVTDIVGEISAASTEQSAGVSQVGEAVAQMDQATQQNAALVEESAAAAESLRQQATNLLGSVATFKLSADAPSVTTSNTVSAVASAASVKPAVATPAALPAVKVAAYTGTERRGPNRAKNVVRPAFKAPAAAATVSETAEPASRTGTDDWESF